jgi:polyhydroxyalkanoate synthesis regulator phasin
MSEERRTAMAEPTRDEPESAVDELARRIREVIDTKVAAAVAPLEARIAALEQRVMDLETAQREDQSSV